ncbi:glutathione S-transferase family protein [Leptothrix sp. BB-4]
MLTVHHLENSRSQRVLWLLEELGLPYEVRRHERDRETLLAPPELLAVHPLGKSPVIVDTAADGSTVTVAETGAIVEYLIERHGDGRLKPATGTPELLAWRYWLHFAEGSAMTPLLMKLVFDRIATAPMPFFAKPIAKAIAARTEQGFFGPNLRRQADFIEAELARQPWFAGAEFSAADIMMSFPLEAAAHRAGLGANGRHPHAKAWLARIHARPAYQRALQRGGPYAYA